MSKKTKSKMNFKPEAYNLMYIYQHSSLRTTVYIDRTRSHAHYQSSEGIKGFLGTEISLTKVFRAKKSLPSFYQVETYFVCLVLDKHLIMYLDLSKHKIPILFVRKISHSKTKCDTTQHHQRLSSESLEALLLLPKNFSLMK